MTDKPPAPTYDWRVRIKGEPHPIPVHAAYFNEAGITDFIEFKDGNHKRIYLIARDVVLDIGRLDPERHELDQYGRRKAPPRD